MQESGMIWIKNTMLLKALEQAEDNERELSQRIYELEEELYLKDMERESKEEE